MTHSFQHVNTVFPLLKQSKNLLVWQVVGIRANLLAIYNSYVDDINTNVLPKRNKRVITCWSQAMLQLHTHNIYKQSKENRVIHCLMLTQEAKDASLLIAHLSEIPEKLVDNTVSAPKAIRSVRTRKV